jgi:peroxiredoxin
LQDIIAPFYIFLRTKFEAHYFKHSEDFSKTTSIIHTQTSVNVGNVKMKSNKYKICIKNGVIESLEVETKRDKMTISQVFKQREL